MEILELNATPTKLSRHQMILARKERPFRAIVSRIGLFGQPEVVAEFEMSAVFGEVAHDAIPGSAVFADLGDAAVDNLVARALASVQHRKTPIRR